MQFSCPEFKDKLSFASSNYNFISLIVWDEIGFRLFSISSGLLIFKSSLLEHRLEGLFFLLKIVLVFTGKLFTA